MSAKEQQELHEKIIRQTLERIGNHKGVYGYMVINPKTGIILECVGFEKDKKKIAEYCDKIMGFLILTQSTVRTIDHQDELTLLRMRWRHREVIVAPDTNKEYVLLVVHQQVPEAVEQFAESSPTDEVPK